MFCDTAKGSSHSVNGRLLPKGQGRLGRTFQPDDYVRKTEENHLMEVHSLLRPMRYWYFIPIALCLLCDVGGGLLWAEGFSITEENGLLENSQVFFLALAVGFNIRQISVSNDTRARISHAVLGVLFLSIMIREVDIDLLGSAPIWESVQFVIRFGDVILWFFLGFLVFRNLRAFWRSRFDILFSPNSIMTAVGILFYMFSWYFDKSASPNLEWNRLWEELLQLNGTVFFFAASLQPLILQGHSQHSGFDNGRESINHENAVR